MNTVKSRVDESTVVRQFSANSTYRLVSSLTGDTPLIDVSIDTEVIIRDAVSIDQEVSSDTGLTGCCVVRFILITQVLDTKVTLKLEALKTLLTAINITKHPLLTTINRVANSLV